MDRLLPLLIALAVAILRGLLAKPPPSGSSPRSRTAFPPCPIGLALDSP